MSDANPYAPPQAVSIAPRPLSDVRLFGPHAIAAHTVLMTPVVGAVLAAMNHRRRGDGAAFRRTVFAFVLPSALLVVVIIAASDRFAGTMRLVTLVWSISVARMLLNEHRPLFDSHLRAGGRRARWYLATLTALGAFAVIVVAAAVVAMAWNMPT